MVSLFSFWVVCADQFFVFVPIFYHYIKCSKFGPPPRHKDSKEMDHTNNYYFNTNMLPFLFVFSLIVNGAFLLWVFLVFSPFLIHWLGHEITSRSVVVATTSLLLVANTLFHFRILYSHKSYQKLCNQLLQSNDARPFARINEYTLLWLFRPQWYEIPKNKIQKDQESLVYLLTME